MVAGRQAGSPTSPTPAARTKSGCIAPDGKELARQLTTGGDTYKYEIAWSPDSKKILWADKKLRLQYVEVATKTVKPIAQAKVWEIRDAVWSPDSKWIAYSQEEREGMNQGLYSILAGTGQDVHGHRRLVRFSPPRSAATANICSLSPSAISQPIYSETEWNHAYRDMARIYLVTLAKDTPSPFQPRSDDIG